MKNATINYQWSIGALLIGILLMADISFAKIYFTQEEALKRAFPGADGIETVNLYLTEKEKERIESLAKAKLDSRLFVYHEVKKGGDTAGYVLIRSLVVRSRQAVIMVVLKGDKTIRNIEVLAFYEPEEYLPRKLWFEQFLGRSLDDSLWPRRGIAGVAGATLSVDSITREIRKVLAVSQTMIHNGER